LIKLNSLKVHNISESSELIY